MYVCMHTRTHTHIHIHTCIQLLDTHDDEGGYAFLDDDASVHRPWDVVLRLKTEYLNCVNGIAFQNEQLGENKLNTSIV